MNGTTSSNGRNSARIVKTEDVLGGKARIAETRISVHFVRDRIEGRGLEPKTVADRHDLSVADVYRALAYYHEHPDEMAATEADREQLRADAEGDSDIATGPEDAPLSI